MITKNTVVKILSCYMLQKINETGENFSTDEDGNDNPVLFSLNDRKGIRYFAKWLKKFIKLSVDVNVLLKSSENKITLDSLTDYINQNNPDANDIDILTQICNRYENLISQRNDAQELDFEISQFIDDKYASDDNDDDIDPDEIDPEFEAKIRKLVLKDNIVAQEEPDPVDKKDYVTLLLDNYIIINRTELINGGIHYLRY